MAALPRLTCPACGKPVYDEDALSCIFCDETLPRRIGIFGTLRHAGPVVIAIALLAAGAFLLLTLLHP